MLIALGEVPYQLWFTSSLAKTAAEGISRLDGQLKIILYRSPAQEPSLAFRQ